MLDSARADRLQTRWEITAETIPLELVDCPDRRLGRAALQLISRLAAVRTEITVLLPRRSYSSVLGRLLHDRTADRIARLVSRLPYAVATIVPFDTAAGLAAGNPHSAAADSSEMPATSDRHPAPVAGANGKRDAVLRYSAPEPAADADAIGRLGRGQLADIEGRVRTVQVAALAGSSVFTCEVVDSTGTITALFYGRRHIAGISPGRSLRLQGRPIRQNGKLIITNPTYELLAPPEPDD